MKKLLTILFLFFSVISFAQKTKNTVSKKQPLPANTEVWTINAERAQCEGVITKQCLLVKKQGGKFFELFYDDIKGFEYEEGFTYVIWVKKELKTPPIPADASIYNYTLVNTVSKKSVFSTKKNNVKNNHPRDKFKDVNKSKESSNASVAKNIVLIINEEKTPCNGNPDSKCLLVKKPNSKTFEIFYQEIKGFKFEEGYRQTILVNERRVENSNIKQAAPIYTLLQVQNKELVFTPIKQDTIAANNKLTIDKRWILRKMKDTDTSITLIDGDGVFMEIKSYENKVIGKAPCNSFTGGLTVDNSSKFQVVAIANTRKYCENNMKFEELFFTLLQNAERYEIVADKLYLYKGDRLLLVFE